MGISPQVNCYKGMAKVAYSKPQVRVSDLGAALFVTSEYPSF
jgi:hypothetical protein